MKNRNCSCVFVLKKVIKKFSWINYHFIYFCFFNTTIMAKDIFLFWNLFFFCLYKKLQKWNLYHFYEVSMVNLTFKILNIPWLKKKKNQQIFKGINKILSWHFQRVFFFLQYLALVCKIKICLIYMDESASMEL